MRNYIPNLFAILLLASCQKQPTASFTTDKETYQAGETIHFTDASTNAKHWNWILPDGSSATTQNVDFSTDSNQVDETKTIYQEVTSQNNKKKSSSSKLISISQKVFYTDFLSINSTSNYWGAEKYTFFNPSNFGVKNYKNLGLRGENIEVYFSGNNAVSGLYIVDSSLNNLQPMHAYIKLNRNAGPDANFHYTSTNGNISVVVKNNGLVEFSFNQLILKGIESPASKETLSCNIKFHLK